MSQVKHVYDYPRPMVTVDAVVFGLREGVREVLLIERKHEPWQGSWALPGGFVDLDETLDAAVARELAEETGLYGVKLAQFHTFGAVNRDPRGRVITVAFTALVNWRDHAPRADDDAADVRWWPLDRLPSLAGDHDEIIRYAILWHEREGWQCM